MTPFDPYHKWLGIPPDQQPAGPGRLLGISDDENDPQVVREAALRQTAFVRTFSIGEHGEHAERILGELADARDSILSGKVESPTKPAVKPTPSLMDSPLVNETAKADRETPQAEPIPREDPLKPKTNERTGDSPKPSTRSGARSGKPIWQQPWATAAGGAIAMLLIMMLLGSRGTDNKEPANTIDSQAQQQNDELKQKVAAAENIDSLQTAAAAVTIQATANNEAISNNVAIAPPPAVAPFGATQAKEYQQAWADHLGIPVVTTNSVGMKLALIPPGEFMMGSDEFEEDEKPVHKVMLTRPIQLGVYEVTQEQYLSLISGHLSKWNGLSRPVDQVSWTDAVAFCALLSDLPEEKSAGRKYRLPTEAEWEYSCRAGTATVYGFGDDVSKLGDFAWYKENTRLGTRPVGEKLPNAWGIFDMHGNTWEWCADWKGNYPQLSVVDPEGPLNGSARVSRGGHWDTSSISTRTANRGGTSPSTRFGHQGFRVACVIHDNGIQPSKKLDTVQTMNTLTIHAAFYGANVSWFDVTQKVSQMAEGKAFLSFVPSNSLFGNPAPSWNGTRSLVVRYSIGTDMPRMAKQYEKRPLNLGDPPR